MQTPTVKTAQQITKAITGLIDANIKMDKAGRKHGKDSMIHAGEWELVEDAETTLFHEVALMLHILTETKQ